MERSHQWRPFHDAGEFLRAPATAASQILYVYRAASEVFIRYVVAPHYATARHEEKVSPIWQHVLVD